MREGEDKNLLTCPPIGWLSQAQPCPPDLYAFKAHGRYVDRLLRRWSDLPVVDYHYSKSAPMPVVRFPSGVVLGYNFYECLVAVPRDLFVRLKIFFSEGKRPWTREEEWNPSFGWREDPDAVFLSGWWRMVAALRRCGALDSATQPLQNQSPRARRRFALGGPPWLTRRERRARARSKGRPGIRVALTPPPALPYVCTGCGAGSVTPVKLWREIREFVPLRDLLCAACCTRTRREKPEEYGPIQKDGRCEVFSAGRSRGLTDSVADWMLPAIPNDAGSFWGYGAQPEDRSVWWDALPLAEVP